MVNPNDVKALLEQLCLDLGFCLPPSEAARLCASPPRTVLDFTEAVFRAEGLLPPEVADRRLFRQVRDRVANAFRSSEERSEPPAHSATELAQNFPHSQRK
jgi:hypothetical protein